MTPELRIVLDHPDVFPDDFAEFIADNIHVWRAFVREAFAVRAKGYRHYSARTIIHFLRHHTAMSEVNSGWKINDHRSPYLARLFDLRFPGLAGMWSMRETPRVHRKDFLYDSSED
jgi:hypothetical protein